MRLEGHQWSQTVSNGILNPHVEGIKQALGDSAKAICEMNQKRVCRIHVEDFKQHWLKPLLHDLDETISRNWIYKVSLTPYDKVNIVDDNNNVLAVVPAFCESTSNYVKSGFSIYENMSAIKNASGIKRNDIVNKLYNHFNKNLEIPNLPIENFAAWIHLAEYFNEQPKWLSGFKTLVEKNNKKDNTTSSPDSGRKDDDLTVFEPV